MNTIEFQWLEDHSSHKEALQAALGCSGQLLKKHLTSKDLKRDIKKRSISKLPLDLVNHLQINPRYSGPQAKILADRPNYLVVHKPSLCHSHPLCYSDQDTLINFLAQEGQWQALKVNAASYDRGLINRLDYETSGVMIVAKNEQLLQKLRSDFNEQMKRKLYWAIVEGDFNQDGYWTHYFRATGLKGAKQKVDTDSHSDAEVGHLEVRKILHHEGKSLVLVNLSTGIRHQIRAQLAALGFPLLGDELYGGKQAERLYLHALRYEWDEVEEDKEADLFERFFDLDRALQMSHDMLRIFKRR